MKNVPGKVGFWSALTAFMFTSFYVVVQLLQLFGALTFPFDEVLIYGSSLGITVPFLLSMLALHHVTVQEDRFWTHSAVIFAVIYSVFVIANYVVQLATVIPATVSGAAETIQLLRQTPHSMFWDYDAIGYIFMGLAMLISLPALNRTGPQRQVHRAFLANALMTPVITIVYFYPTYSDTLLMLGLPWGFTAPLAMLMLAISFKRNAMTKGQTHIIELPAESHQVPDYRPVEK